MPENDKHRRWFVFDRWVIAIGAAVFATLYLARGGRSPFVLIALICVGAVLAAYSFRYWSEPPDKN